MKAVEGMNIAKNYGRSPLYRMGAELDAVPRTKLMGAYGMQGHGVSKSVQKFPEVVSAGIGLSKTRKLGGRDPEFASFM
eukprot:287158-Amphidinium_carterae.1